MKLNIIILSIATVILASCASSNKMTTNVSDDLYYWPGDETVVADQSVKKQKEKENDDLFIVSKIGKDESGARKVDNYIYAEKDPEWFAKVQAYNLDNLTDEDQDTIIYADDLDTNYVVNNYYMDDEYSYSDRIRYFYDPYYYDPFYSPYYRHHAYRYSLAWGFGWGGYYGGFYDPWYDPYYYGGWYSSYSGCYNGYYSGYYGYYGGGYHHFNSYPYVTVFTKNNNESKRRSRNPNLVSTGGAAGSEVYAFNDTRVQQKSAVAGNGSQGEVGRRVVSNRQNVNRASTRSVTNNARSNNPVRNSQVLTEKRRNSAAVTRTTVGSTSAKPSRTQVYRTVTSNPARTSYNNSSVGRSNDSRVSVPSYSKPRTATTTKYRTTANSARTSRDAAVSKNSRGRYTIPSTNSKSSESRTSYTRTSSSRNYSNTNATRSRSNSSSYNQSTPSRSYSPSNSSSRSYSTPSSNRSSYTPSRSYSGGSRSSYSSGSSRSSGSSGTRSSSGSRR